MARYYSFEIYAPETDDDAGARIDYEDYFGTVGDATAAMLESMGDAPDGSTAIVYQRSADGDMLLPHREWLKDGVSARRVRETRT